MKKQIGLLLCMLIMPFIALLSRNAFASQIEIHTFEWLTMIQKSDLAGLATIVTADPTNLIFEIDVKQWWLGSWPTNRFSIYNAYEEGQYYDERIDYYKWSGWNPMEKIGCDVVFFAMTNIYKRNSSPEPGSFAYDWNYARTFTNSYEACPPTFVSPSCPTVFLLDTDYDYRVNLLSNITYSLFFTGDKMQLYRGLRDAYGVEGKSIGSYRAIGQYPLRFMTYRNDFPESDYVTMLNDPLLYPQYRTNVLSSLIQDYNWSPTNTVPVP